MDDMIRQVIVERKEVEFEYEGGRRIGKIAAYGFTKKDNTAIRFYQTEGSSKSDLPGWRLMVTSKISKLATTGQTFVENPPGYVQNDQDLKIIRQLD